MGQPGQQPHGKKRDRRPERPARFGYKTTATRPKNTKHFGDGAPAIWQNGEKARRNQDVKGSVRVRQLQNIVTLKPTIVQSEGISFLPGPTELTRGTIDAEHES